MKRYKLDLIEQANYRRGTSRRWRPFVTGLIMGFLFGFVSGFIVNFILSARFGL